MYEFAEKKAAAMPAPAPPSWQKPPASLYASRYPPQQKPKGPEPGDVFDRQGRLVSHTPGTAVRVQNQDGTTQPLSQAFKGGREDVRMLREIAVHYALQVGISGNLVGVGQTSIKGAAAFHDPKDNSIRINAFGNKIDSALDNVNAFKSLLDHERIHRDNYAAGSEDMIGKKHADVYIKQMQSAHFLDSPLLFRESLVGGMLTELFTDKKIFYEEAQAYLLKNQATLAKAGLRVQLTPVGMCRTCVEYQVNNHPARAISVQDK